MESHYYTAIFTSPLKYVPKGEQLEPNVGPVEQLSPEFRYLPEQYESVAVAYRLLISPANDTYPLNLLQG